MFRLYHSNDLDVLKQLLIHDLAINPPSPFECEQIMVQSQGMAHWLKLNIADSLGIAAQIDFPLPSSFIWRIFNYLRPDLPERSHFDKRILTWKLMRLLPTAEDTDIDPDFELLQRYQQHDSSGIKRYQLASNIADVYDQYLVYRPDWIMNWEEGIDAIDGADVSLYPWQPKLWRQLIEDSQIRQHSLEHRARLLTNLADLVKQHGDRLTAMLPKRIFVFGIAALPNAYWQVLKAISTKIDVHYCALNPCQNFWGDIVSDKQRLHWLQNNVTGSDLLDRGHPLLASWGRLGRDFLTLVHEQTLAGPERLDESIPGVNQTHHFTGQDAVFNMVDIDAYVTPSSTESNHLLANIQQDLLQLQDAQAAAFSVEALTTSRFKRVVTEGDDSVRVVLAHNPIREVQRLHDQLLAWLAEDSSLEAKDILIMVPDIDQYAPYVDAVFSSVPADIRLPWSVADQSVRAENPLIDAFLNLLALPDHRVLINDVMDWLELPALQQKLQMSGDQIVTVRHWLQQVRVCWGLNPDHRQQLGVPNFDQNSWSKGLRQLLLGFAMSDAQINQQDPASEPFYDDMPVAGIEGSQSELLGQLIELIERLDHWRQWLQTSRNIQAWQTGLIAMINDIFASGSDDDTTLQTLRDAVDQLVEAVAEADFRDAIEPAVLRQMMSDKLSQQGGWARFMAGSINVCTLMPMRSIPFRVVCLLGMNDEDYPRQVTPVGFDLVTAGRRRRGDRSRRDDDRYLFLEAVCSAQDKLYLSYRGHDARDNSERQPSVLVSELLDYVCDSMCLAADHDQPAQISHQNLRQWLVEHCPLQPFSRQVFIPQAKTPMSFNTLWAQVAASSGQPENLAPASNDAINATSSRDDNLLDDVIRQHDHPEEKGSGILYAEFAQRALPLDPEQGQQPVVADDIISALLNSCRFYLNQVVGASLGATMDDLVESEPFVLNGLDQYLSRRQVLAQHLSQRLSSPFASLIEQPLDSPVKEVLSSSTQQDRSVRRLRASGQLPVAGFGDLSAMQIQQDVMAVLSRCQPWLANLTPRPRMDGGQWSGLMTDLNGEQYNLNLLLSDEPMAAESSLTWQSGQSLLQVETSRFKAQQVMQAWWQMVCQVLADQQNGTEPSYDQLVLISISSRFKCWQNWSALTDNGQTTCLTLRRPTADVAQQWLQLAIRFYWQSWSQPHSHLPELAGRLCLLDDTAAERMWLDYIGNEYSEIHQPAIQRCFADITQQLSQEENRDRWQQFWQPLWQPICDAVIEDNPDAHWQPTSESIDPREG